MSYAQQKEKAKPRTKGSSNLFAPALAQAGLKPGRVIYLEAGDEQTALACLEEALRHGGLGAAIAEISKLTMT
ncbi:MAG: hypothetical protein ABWY00_05240, partial [Dongiaceae bacterium]